MARAIVSRLLHEPTLRLKGAVGEEASYRYVHALRELFGLDAAPRSRASSPPPRSPSSSRAAAARGGA